LPCRDGKGSRAALGGAAREHKGAAREQRGSSEGARRSMGEHRGSTGGARRLSKGAMALAPALRARGGRTTGALFGCSRFM